MHYPKPRPTRRNDPGFAATAPAALDRATDIHKTAAREWAPAEMQTRSFTSFTDAAEECADSRVRLGFHFR